MKNIALSAIACISMLNTQAFAQEHTKLTDPEIAAVVVAANKNDIEFAEIAMKKSKNPEVLKFANTMATDHKSVNDQATALVTKLKVTPKDNAVSKKLTANAEKTKKMLESKSDKDFDKAYIDNEVVYHKGVITTVDKVLIPEANNEELKALLVKVAPVLKTHLQHAEMLKSNNNAHASTHGKKS